MQDLINLLNDMGVDTKTPKKIKCPFHEDTKPSAGVVNINGTYKFSCRVCGITDSYNYLFKRVHGTFPNDPTNDTPKQIKELRRVSIAEIEGYNGFTTWHIYSNDFRIARFDYDNGDKKFNPIRKYGEYWIFGKPPKVPLYGDLEKALFWVEGEKCVDYLKAIGIPSITSCGGVNGFKDADFDSLKLKQVAIWPDNDKAGFEYADKIAEILDKKDIQTARVDPTDFLLNEKEDVADFIKYCKDGGRQNSEIMEEIFALTENIKFNTLSDKFFDTRVKDLESGVLKSIPLPFPTLLETRCMIGGTVTLLCSPAGVGKTYFLHNLMKNVIDEGYKVSNIQLEEDWGYHISRVLEMEGFSGMSDPDTYSGYEDRSKIEPYIEKYGSAIKMFDTIQGSYKELAEMVRKEAEGGSDLIIVDPVSALGKGKDIADTDLNFINTVKDVVSTYKCRVWLSVHPAKGMSKELSMDSLAGGAAYPRLAQAIIWLRGCSKQVTVTLNDGFTELQTKPDRILQILKARNMKGEANLIAYEFKNAKYREMGIIKK